MQKTTIDYGIDLGTTNSAIAVMNNGQVEIVKSRNFETTPSIIYMNKKGTCFVGESGKGRLADPKSTSDVQFEFKRLMGQQMDLDFKSANTSMSPEELSAEVLKELGKAAEVRFQDQLRAAIITIPAMFETPQREATANAGKLAGFDHCQLLAEPVAAAVAYGFRAEAENVFWLVYDFGGGTFDTSIVAVRDGQISVVNHEGDNHLGGADFDWVLVEKAIIPHLQENYDLSNLSRQTINNDVILKANMYKLKLLAEQMKIDLSSSSHTDLYEEDIFEDESGETVDLEISLTREKFDELISGMVDQSLRIVDKLLKTAKLKPSDIQKTLLVGGTTFSPLVRERVEGLGIPVDYEIDPMTVVARGAAVFAASQRLPDASVNIERKTGHAFLELEYKPVAKEPAPLVGGKLTMGKGVRIEPGMTLEINRDDGGWTSGSIPLETSGLFFANVSIREDEANSFAISVKDSQGNTIEVTGGIFTITYGLSVAKATLPVSIRLINRDGSTTLLLSKGSELPATIEGFHIKTTKGLTKGDSGDELHIAFGEGEEELADHNQLGSRIIIKGDDEKLTRSLPEGTELEVSAEVDESMVSHYRVFVPLIDDDFEAPETKTEYEPPDIMAGRIRALEQRLHALKEKEKQVDNEEASQRIVELDSDNRIIAIKDNISAWSGNDHAAGGRARNLLIDFHKDIEGIEDLLEWPTILNEHQESLDLARKQIHKEGDGDSQKILAQLEKEGDGAIAAADLKMLKSVTSRLNSLYLEILAKNPSAWIYLLQYLEEESHQMNDQAKAETCFREGKQAVERRDFETLKSVVHQLITMLPEEVKDKFEKIRSDVQ